MIRIATESDVPAMLAIYAPYIEDTTYSFEYTVPSEEEFIRRFREITAQFPCPLPGRLMPGPERFPSTLRPRPRAEALAGGSIPRWSIL